VSPFLALPSAPISHPEDEPFPRRPPRASISAYLAPRGRGQGAAGRWIPFGTSVQIRQTPSDTIVGKSHSGGVLRNSSHACVGLTVCLFIWYQTPKIQTLSSNHTAVQLSDGGVFISHSAIRQYAVRSHAHVHIPVSAAALSPPALFQRCTPLLRYTLPPTSTSRISPIYAYLPSQRLRPVTDASPSRLIPPSSLLPSLPQGLSLPILCPDPLSTN
jgi:hypothetical protein